MSNVLVEYSDFSKENTYDVFDNVKVTSKLTPKNQYNYFTVSINTSNDDILQRLLAQ